MKEQKRERVRKYYKENKEKCNLKDLLYICDCPPKSPGPPHIIIDLKKYVPWYI